MPRVRPWQATGPASTRGLRATSRAGEYAPASTGTSGILRRCGSHAGLIIAGRGARIERADKGAALGQAATGACTARLRRRYPMSPTRWLPALILALAVACAPATAALARPAPSAPPGTPWRCTTAAPSGACGPYSYPAITKSNGYNTYVANNMWGCGGATCGPRTVRANAPGTRRSPPDRAAGTPPSSPTPTCSSSSLAPPATARRSPAPASIRSRFTETMPPAAAGTIAEAGYDIWTSYSSDIMIWVDNQAPRDRRRCSDRPRNNLGQAFTVLQYGGTGGEIIFSLDHNGRTGTVHSPRHPALAAGAPLRQSHRHDRAGGFRLGGTLDGRPSRKRSPSAVLAARRMSAPLPAAPGDVIAVVTEEPLVNTGKSDR